MNIPFNINNYIHVKLNDDGKCILQQNRQMTYKCYVENEDGYINMQMWIL